MQRATTRPSALFDDLASHGDNQAIITAGSQITYAELDDRVRACAARLGPVPRLVAVEAGNTVEALVAYLGGLRGNHTVLLSGAGNPDSQRQLLRTYDPDVVIDGASGWAVDARRTGTAHDLHPDLRLLLSTSGSTGSPKMVRLSGDNLRSNARAIARYLGITSADRAITTLPMPYCYGLSVINSHLLAGAGVVLTDLSVVDRCFWDLFRRSGATSFAGVPHTFELLDRAGFGSMALPSLRYVTQAGGRMRPETVRRYAAMGERDGWELYVMYGQTEATARMAYLPPPLASTRPQAIGVPIPGGSFTIDEPDVDGVGELVYRGANVMMGYAQRPADLALGPTGDVLRTGDLGRVDADGVYEVVGRRNRFIKPFGLRIDLDQIERLLLDDGIPNLCTGDDDRLIVAVTRADDVRLAAGRIAADLPLPRTCVHVVALDVLPRLHNGKPDYAVLLATAPAIDRVARADRGAETGHDHRPAIRAAFADILGVDPALDDTFVGLGGDSLSYVEMSTRLELVLGALPRDWHITPVGDLARAARAGRFMARVDTSVVMRAVAIVLVVGTHAQLWYAPGGAHALLAVAGYNFARFQLGGTTMRSSILRLAVPSMCWIAIVASVSDKFGWPNALLVNGFTNRPGDRWSYWFVEALVQILIPLAALSAIPAVVRLERRRPFALPVCAVLTGLLVRYDVIEPTTTKPAMRAHEVFWLFALGWAASRASTWQRRVIVSVLAAIGLYGFFGNTQREVTVMGGIALLAWAPTVPVPQIARRIIAPIAAASLAIYLTHFQVYPPLSRLHGPVLAVAGSIAVGICAWWVARRLVAWCELGVRRLRPLARSPRPATGPDVRRVAPVAGT